MAAKKKVAKPNVTIKQGKDKPDVELKVRNLGKVIKENEKCNRYKYGGSCMIFGSSLAMILSYERSASILWAIFHGILSWFYIIFRAMQIWGWF
jgi:hypothetical protein